MIRTPFQILNIDTNSTVFIASNENKNNTKLSNQNQACRIEKYYIQLNNGTTGHMVGRFIFSGNCAIIVNGFLTGTTSSEEIGFGASTWLCTPPSLFACIFCSLYSKKY